jgi:16S rRNA G527 N7-methylase RsmG
MGIPVNAHTVFLDIGSGRGLPNFVAALFAGKSLGVEHDRTRCQVVC